jgi:SAM-dependent methyltransferase
MTLPLAKRMDQMVEILHQSNDQIREREYGRRCDKPFLNDTGFQPLWPGYFSDAAKRLSTLCPNRKKKVSLDLGCGNGGWALTAAVLGFSSYGIDFSPELIEEARKNLTLAREKGLIKRETICQFAIGNMYPQDWIEEYKKAREKRYRDETMPLREPGQPYQELGIRLKEADVVYSFPYEDQMPVLCQCLAQESKPTAFFFLPHYAKMSSYMRLKLDPVEGPGYGLDTLWKRNGKKE